MEPPTVASLTTFLSNSLLRTLITDLAIEEHRIVCRRRAECISSSLRQAGVPSAHGFLAPPLLKGSGSLSRASSPGPSVSPNKRDDALYDCLNCTRVIAASRYASHLAGCMGLGGAGGTRRGESRRVAAAAATAANANGRGATALARGSVYAESDEDSTSAHGGTDRKTTLKINLGGTKRASSTPLAGDKPLSRYKRQKLAQAQAQAAAQSSPGVQLTSHPLSKTLSAPSTPLSSSFPISRPQPQLLSQPPRPPSAPMIQRNSLPTKQPAKQPSKQPARPRPPPPPAGSDRPDSDSSAEDDSADERPVQVARKAPKKSQQFGQGPNARGPHPLAKGIETDSGSDASVSDGSDSD